MQDRRSSDESELAAGPGEADEELWNQVGRPPPQTCTRIGFCYWDVILGFLYFTHLNGKIISGIDIFTLILEPLAP